MLAEHLDERQLVELPMLVGHYHLVAFALNSLGVQIEDGAGPRSRAHVTATAGRTHHPRGRRRHPAHRRRGRRRRATAGPSRSSRRARGARVVCVDRDAASAEATAAQARAEGGGADVVVADVRDEGACADLVAEAVRLAGPELHGVVLNVGIGRGRGLEGTSVADWDTVFAVNIRSHFLVAQAAAPHVPEGGSFVFVSSMAGLRPGSRSPPTTRPRPASSGSTATWRWSARAAASGRTSSHPG